MLNRSFGKISSAVSAACLLAALSSLSAGADAADSNPVDPIGSKENPTPVDDGLKPTAQIDLDLGDLSTFAQNSTVMAQSGAGFIGQIGDAAHRAATLYFTNADKVPGALADEAAKLDVTINVLPWPYSQEEMEQAVQRIHERYHGRLPDGFKMMFFGTFDLTARPGIAISGSYDDKSVSVPDEAIRGDVEAVAKVPVRFEASDGPIELTSGRDDDFSPFWAGGVMQSSSNSTDVCSNGFNITVGGASHVTTATQLLSQRLLRA